LRIRTDIILLPAESAFSEAELNVDFFDSVCAPKPDVVVVRLRTHSNALIWQGASPPPRPVRAELEFGHSVFLSRKMIHAEAQSRREEKGLTQRRNESGAGRLLDALRFRRGQLNGAHSAPDPFRQRGIPARHKRHSRRVFACDSSFFFSAPLREILLWPKTQKNRRFWATATVRAQF
jgi:hypothetical protein